MHVTLILKFIAQVTQKDKVLSQYIEYNSENLNEKKRPNIAYVVSKKEKGKFKKEKLRVSNGEKPH